MSRFRLILISLATVLVGAVGVAGTVSASAVYRTSENGANTIAKDTTVDGSAYLAGQTIRVSGTVQGDVYCAGNAITIDGTVEGDVLCAGSDITIDGTVNGSVRVAGSSVSLAGTIAGTASVFAGNVRVEESLVLAGDLNGAAGTVTIDGTVGRDMTVATGALILNGTVTRDVQASIGSVTFSDDATVGGAFNYSSNSELSIPSEAVAGETVFTKTSHDSTYQPVDMTWFFFFAVVAVAVFVMLATAVMPRQVHAVGDVSWQRFGLAAVVGLTFMIVAPIAAAFLAISGIGGYAAYVLLLVWLGLMAVSPVPVAYFLGTKIYGARSNNVLVRATFGALVLMLALSFPLLNVFFIMLMGIVGVGLILVHVPSLYEGGPYQVMAKKKKKSA